VTVVAVGSVRSCGVTTMAAGLAMVWPDQARRVLIEADPAGGTLAAACGLAAEPGLVSLAAAARRQPDPALVFEHSQALPDATPVVATPAAGEQARSALGMLAPLLGRLGQLEGAVVVDCGRLDHTGAGSEIFEAADLAVLACRPQLADLNALAAFLQPDEEARRRPVVVLVGPGPYPPAEISDTLGLEVAGSLPWDPDAAAGLATSAPSSRGLTRSPLVRALRSLADDLAHRVGPEQSSDTDAPAAAPVMAEAGL
jgi:MinD-like ATPase involved in chromosome partitioning or flagellar assembly